MASSPRAAGDAPAAGDLTRVSARAPRQVPPRRRSRTYLQLATVLLGAGLLLGVIVAVAGESVSDSDRPFNIWWFDLARNYQVLADYAAGMQVLGSGNITGPIGVLFGIALALFRRWRWLVFFAASAIGGLIISETLKRLVARPRPQWSDPFFSEHGYSYPSGHTLSGVTTWVAMGLVVMFVLARPWGTLLGWMLVLIGVEMGPSRWLYGVHWITDVLGGWLLGFGWLFLVAGLCLRWWGRDDAAETRRRSPGATIAQTPS